MSATTKVCTKCRAAKALDEFHKSNRARGLRTPRNGFGVEAVCKDCKVDARNPTLRERRQRTAELAAIGLKSCTRCGIDKPFTAFTVRRASKDGLNPICAECAKHKTREWLKAHPNTNKDWSRKNKGYNSERNRRWRIDNYAQNRANYKRWCDENQDKVRAIRAKRFAAKMSATPPWADMDAIAAVYSEAVRLSAETGVPHDVDHIVPLRSPVVCGLHVAWNLRPLPKLENIRKGNRLTPQAIALPRQICAAPRTSV
jgi:hypothetical protein